MKGRSGGLLCSLEGTFTQSDSATLSAVGGIVGDVLRMLHQNRTSEHQRSDLIGSSAVTCLHRTAAHPRPDVSSS